MKNLTSWILSAVVAGVATGAAIGKNAAWMGEIAKAVVQLVKIGATPLLFFTIVSSVLKANLGWKTGGRVLAIASVNASIALFFGLLYSNLFRPGAHFEKALLSSTEPAAVKTPSALGFAPFVQSLIPESLLVPFLKNDILTIVLLALVLGFALKKVRKEQGVPDETPSPVWVDSALAVVEKILSWFVQLIPIAVFGAVAKSVGEYGFAPLRGLMSYLGVALLGLLTHSLVVYPLWIRSRGIALKAFFREAKEPVVYAIGVNSSLATLPVTLQSLKRLGVSSEARAVGAGIATNFNNDGILLYEAMAVLFIAQAHGIHLDLPQQILAALACMVAGLGIAGIPEAGFVALSVVLVTVGLPTEFLPLLLTVDWIIARARSAVNVLSDMTLSIAVDRSKRSV